MGVRRIAPVFIRVARLPAAPSATDVPRRQARLLVRRAGA
jgi:hypothetical protein